MKKSTNKKGIKAKVQTAILLKQLCATRKVPVVLCGAVLNCHAAELL